MIIYFLRAYLYIVINKQRSPVSLVTKLFYISKFPVFVHLYVLETADFLCDDSLYQCAVHVKYDSLGPLVLLKKSYLYIKVLWFLFYIIYIFTTTLSFCALLLMDAVILVCVHSYLFISNFKYVLSSMFQINIVYFTFKRS